MRERPELRFVQTICVLLPLPPLALLLDEATCGCGVSLKCHFSAAVACMEIDGFRPSIIKAFKAA